MRRMLGKGRRLPHCKDCGMRFQPGQSRCTMCGALHRKKQEFHRSIPKLLAVIIALVIISACLQKAMRSVNAIPEPVSAPE